MIDGYKLLLWVSICVLAGLTTVIVRAAVLYLYADFDRATKGGLQTLAMLAGAFAVFVILRHLVGP